tara:strand:+ start:992 stop:1315 length:324 start_codon:yes stop_codon:yes gene_type:complete
MGIFRKKVNIDNLIQSYVNSQLPSGASAYSPLSSEGKSNSLTVCVNSISINFEYSFDDNISTELSDIDKRQLDESIVIPALQQLDKELYTLHSKIEETLKNFRVNNK